MILMICPRRVCDDEMKDILLRSNLVHPQTGWELDSGANEGFLARRESNEGATRDSKSNSKFQIQFQNPIQRGYKPGFWKIFSTISITVITAITVSIIIFRWQWWSMTRWDALTTVWDKLARKRWETLDFWWSALQMMRDIAIGILMTIVVILKDGRRSK